MTLPAGSASLISSITLERWLSGTSSWQNEQWVDYSYYTGQTSGGALDPNGRLGDLKVAQVCESIGGTSTVISTDYYRYYKFYTSANTLNSTSSTNDPSTTGGGDTTFSADSGDGLVYSGIKDVFQGASYARLAAVYGSQSSIDAVSDSDLQPYADNTFQYEPYDQYALQPTNNYATRYAVTSETAPRASYAQVWVLPGLLMVAVLPLKLSVPMLMLVKRFRLS